jgi:hypothetical protein
VEKLEDALDVYGCKEFISVDPKFDEVEPDISVFN